MRSVKFGAFVKNCLIPLNILCHLVAANACDEILGPAAIMGGQGNFPYAAFIEQDGSVRTLPGLPPTGLTYRVAINSQGQGLIGGINGVDAYAALVSPKGELTSIPGLIAPGEIYFVSINESGTGMIGGGHQATNVPFAALVNQNGMAIPFIGLPASGLIYGVAIEESGNGIIGGVGPLDSAYAALTAPNGSLTPLTGLPAQGGIFWVDVNDVGTKLIGGKDQTKVYAAFVDEGVVFPIANLPPGLLYSVAINDAGYGVIGGASSSQAYAALIEPNRKATTVPGIPGGTGIIYNVALNSSRTALLAGFYGSTIPFAAFVTPEGALRPISGLPAGPGFVDGAALHETGVAIIGGTSGNVPFAALVAPNGALTFLDNLPAEGEINSIAISAFENLVPRAMGSYDSLANTQFLLSETLTQHNLFHRDCCTCNDYDGVSSFWLAPFGNEVRQKKRQTVPTYRNHIAGVLLGFDYCIDPELTVGGGLAYAYNDVDYLKRLGNSKIDHESAVFYATFNNPNFYVNVALWAGCYQTKNKRNSFASITSRDKTNGGTISPHLELSKAFSLSPCQSNAVEPYVMLDWANHWHSKTCEKGDSGFNIILRNHCLSILRSEAGVRFYETIHRDWGCLVFEEKIGYVNRTPLGKKFREASFVEAFSSFDVRTHSGSSQNNAVVSLHLECIPSGPESVYASLDYQGEFSASFQSNALIATLGMNF